jgi:leucyl aminopeptidase
MLLKKSLFALSSAMLISTAVMAESATHLVVAPQCLVNKSHHTFKTLATNQHFRLLELTETGMNQLAAVKHHDKQACGGFVDVSLDWNKQKSLRTVSPKAFLDTYTAPAKELAASKHKQTYKIQYEKETQQLLKTISPQTMWANLPTLTDFHNRYANSDTGVQAAEWIKAKVEAMAKETGHTDVKVYLVSTGNWKQPSVVAKFGDSNEAGIVVGGHMDTLKDIWGESQQAQQSLSPHMPGADDDGSGSVTVMETARTILSSGMKFKKPIYFVWYSAEEMGLIGSQYVVADFQKKKIPVAAAIQMDMTGYAHENDQTMWLMTDFVNKDLTSFMEKLITTYVKQPYKFSSCGYACSDHASWHKAGIPAAFPFESAMGEDDPDIHSENDTMDKLSLDHMTDFVKLATSFAVELAVPVSK